MGGFLLGAPYRGPGPQPRHVPWLEFEPAVGQALNLLSHTSQGGEKIICSKNDLYLEKIGRVIKMQ